MNWRKQHRVVAIVITLPLIVISLSGIVLQLRNQFETIQPKAVSAELTSGASFVTFERIIQDHGGDNIDQIILRPGKKNLSLRMKDGMEVQIHPQTGEVMKKAMRMTNLLIDIHQGTWLGAFGQYVLHLPTGLGLFFLIISGIVIYPFKKRKSL